MFGELPLPQSSPNKRREKPLEGPREIAPFGGHFGRSPHRVLGVAHLPPSVPMIRAAAWQHFSPAAGRRLRPPGSSAPVTLESHDTRSALMTNNNMTRLWAGSNRAQGLGTTISASGWLDCESSLLSCAPWRFGSLDLWHFCCARAMAAHFTPRPEGTSLSLAQINPTAAPAQV